MLLPTGLKLVFLDEVLEMIAMEVRTCLVALTLCYREESESAPWYRRLVWPIGDVAAQDD